LESYNAHDVIMQNQVLNNKPNILAELNPIAANWPISFSYFEKPIS